MKSGISYLFIIFSIFLSSVASAQMPPANITEDKEPVLPSLQYGFKVNLINFTYNPFYYPDNTFFFSYPSAALLVNDIYGNTHELEINQLTINRLSKDAYYNDFALLYQYDTRLSKAKNLKLVPMMTPYVIVGFNNAGNSDSARGRYYTNEFYAKLGIGLGVRYNVSKKMFIDIIPSLKLTHFYWLSGRSATLPEPVSIPSQNQLIKFEFKDIFFKVGLGYWF